MQLPLNASMRSLGTALFRQARAQFMLGETYVEELRLAETPNFPTGSGKALDPRTMGVTTAACTPEVPPVVAGVA